MVLHDCPLNLRGNAVSAGYVCANLRVGALHLVGQGLAYVVQETADFGNLYVDSHLGGEHPGQQGYLHAVLEDVLSVAVAVLQPAQELDQLRVHAAHTGLEYSFLSLLADVFLHLLSGLLHHFLYASGMDPTIRYELGDGLPRHLPPDGVKAGDGNGLRGVVDYEIDALSRSL